MIANVGRRVDRVVTKTRLGPDAQVDDKALIIGPTELTRTDPFLVLSEDWFSSPGFEWHPHRGLDTVTMVLDGVLEHGDSLGNAGALEPGDVQWMTAGRGIIHRELAFRNEHAHTLQLWINLPGERKMVPTGYQDLRNDAQPVHREGGVSVRVISGAPSLEIAGPAETLRPVLGVMIALDPSASHSQPIPAQDRMFAYVLSGTVIIAKRPVHAGQVAWSDPIGTGPSTLDLHAPDGDDPATVLLFSAEPLGEPVALGGPFVMNTQAEIAQAFTDFHSGKFGEIPRQARLAVR